MTNQNDVFLDEAKAVLSPAQISRVGSFNRIGRKPRKKLIAEAKVFAQELNLAEFIDWSEDTRIDTDPPKETDGCLESLLIIARDKNKRGDCALVVITAILRARAWRKVST